MELREFLVFWRIWAILCALQHTIAKLEVKVKTFDAQVEENVYFEMIEPEEIGYTYRVRPARGFGIVLNRTLYHAELVPANPLHGCSTISNEESIVGNIALMQRGECSFLSKTINAQRAGAQLAIIYDNDPTYDGRMIEMVADDTMRTVSIPSFFLQGMDGKMILDTLNKLKLERALINIPINVTGLVLGKYGQPPWTLW